MLTYLKLGGSLITHKDRPMQARQQTIDRLAQEIGEFWRGSENGLLIGHGSGSFGHSAAAAHSTAQGASTEEEWRAGSEVWWAARQLNEIVLGSLHAAGLPAVAFPPSASAVGVAGSLRTMTTEPIRGALQGGWIPLVQGDVVLDRDQGLAIASTESVFEALVPELPPDRVLLCGWEQGVYADFPKRERLLPTVTPDQYSDLAAGGAEQTDVTGGMAGKLEFCFHLLEKIPNVEIVVFSGEEPKNLSRALAGDRLGTTIAANR